MDDERSAMRCVMKLRQEMKWCGMTIKELAKRSDISYDIAKRIMRYERQIYLDEYMTMHDVVEKEILEKAFKETFGKENDNGEDTKGD